MTGRKPWPRCARIPATIALAAAALTVLAVDAVVSGTAKALTRFLHPGDDEGERPGSLPDLVMADWAAELAKASSADVDRELR